MIPRVLCSTVGTYVTYLELRLPHSRHARGTLEFPHLDICLEKQSAVIKESRVSPHPTSRRIDTRRLVKPDISPPVPRTYLFSPSPISPLFESRWGAHVPSTGRQRTLYSSAGPANVTPPPLGFNYIALSLKSRSKEAGAADGCRA
jgi:hypothetical protein